jgi:beta-lactamase regulating signal transducer with metallopeptidase domain
MQVLFAYLLKLSFCLALGYLFYFLLLRRMTYYNWNRYFLLLFPLAALVIPLLPIELPQEMKPLNVAFFTSNALPSSAQVAAPGGVAETAQWNFISLLLWAIVAGMVFFMLRFAVRFYSLYKTRDAARLINDGDIKLYHLEGCAAPFSFYNSIYLDTNAYDETELEKIIEHEIVHISQKHTMDMLLSELLCIVQWFNPFVWFMKHAIRQNLEFIADESVLQKGISRQGYQFLLLKVSGAMPYSLANNLLFPSLKKRIQMMNRERTGKIHLLKFMCLIPLVCVLLYSFSGPAPKHSGTASAGAEMFSLSSLSFYTNDDEVANIIRNGQGSSFLKAGGPLSLSLISEEKLRLKSLLEKNGYKNISNHAITFVMDTSAASRSFSVQVTINLDKQQKHIFQSEKTTSDNTAIKWVTDANNSRYTTAMADTKPGKIILNKTQTQSTKAASLVKE